MEALTCRAERQSVPESPSSGRLAAACKQAEDPARKAALRGREAPPEPVFRNGASGKNGGQGRELRGHVQRQLLVEG